MGTVRQYHKICIQRVLQKNIKRVSQSKVLPEQSTEIPRSVTIKRTARERQSKVLLGTPQSKALPGSAIIKYIQGVQQTEVQRGGAIIKMTTRECNIQKYFQGVQQSKV